MNLLEKYTPAELAEKTIEDLKKRKEEKIKSQKIYDSIVRNKVKRNLIKKNRKFYK